MQCQFITVLEHHRENRKKEFKTFPEWETVNLWYVERTPFLPTKHSHTKTEKAKGSNICLILLVQYSTSDRENIDSVHEPWNIP